MFDIIKWFAALDTHQILIFALLAVAVWAAIKSVTASQSKSWLVIMGVALGGVGMLTFLRWYNKKLLKEADEIQKERDIIGGEIKQKKGELAVLKNQGGVEVEKLQIALDTQQKIQEEKEIAGRELQETIDDLNKKYNL